MKFLRSLNLTIYFTALAFACPTLHAMHQLTKVCCAHASTIKKPLMLGHHVNRFIIRPTIKQITHHSIRAPKNIQVLAHDYATAMLQNDKKLLNYLKNFGYLTVYEGPDKHMPDFFTKTNCLAHTNMYGGIHFPKKSFVNGISPLQRFILAHEVGHEAQGDTIHESITSCQIGDAQWYQQEYGAQTLCTSVLHEKKDYDALEARIEDEFQLHKHGSPRDKVLDASGPLCTGMCDTLLALETKYPHDKKLHGLCSDAQALILTKIQPSQSAWSKRYGQFMAQFIK